MSIGDWRGPFATGKLSHHFSGPAVEGDSKVKQYASGTKIDLQHITFDLKTPFCTFDSSYILAFKAK